IAPLQNMVQIIKSSDIDLDKQTCDWIAQAMSQQLKASSYYVGYMMELVRRTHPVRNILLDELPRLHEELNTVLHVDWETDCSTLTGRAERAVDSEYYLFLAAIAHAILLTIRRSSKASVGVGYRVDHDRLVGRTDVTGAVEVDPGGWNLVRLASAVY